MRRDAMDVAERRENGVADARYGGTIHDIRDASESVGVRCDASSPEYSIGLVSTSPFCMDM